MESNNPLSRRDFNRLTTAALGGLLTGAALGCSEGNGAGGQTAAKEGEKKDKHVCRGLNECKTAANACAGQADCSTVAAHHCGSSNECKGQGGCGAKPGENDCKGKGGCAVPLADHAWGTARENFEKRMKAAGKTVGKAPEKKKEKS